MASEPFYPYTSLAAAIRREHVLSAIQHVDDGEKLPRFGPATTYKLIHEGNTYDPKLIVAVAYMKATGDLIIRWDKFKGGPEGANKVLTRLGFEVKLIEDLKREDRDWSNAECRLIVADYFDMLAAELSGQPYNKAEHNRLLRQKLIRSRGSVERKHMNVSAVMVELALPYIDGYKPNVNRQQMLVEVVEDYLAAHDHFFDQPAIAARIEPDSMPHVTVTTAAGVFDDPPDVEIARREPAPWKSRRGRKVDYAIRDAMRRDLGMAGERFTVDLERQRLREARRDDLAIKVEWVASTQGDGMGFDVLSYDERTEGERWLEVKTTNLPKFHPFLVSSAEVACSEAEPSKFHLYRVFNYNVQPRVFVLPGSLRSRCSLEPVVYRAGPPFTLPKPDMSV